MWQGIAKAIVLRAARAAVPGAIVALLSALVDVGLLDGAVYRAVAAALGQ